MATLISCEPATGEELWRGECGDAAVEVAAARAAAPEWAMRSQEVRAETMRRFANVVRANEARFADLIARETGRPLWDARGEVDGVIAKVDISIKAQGERTPRRIMDGAVGTRTAVRHKPHGVLAVLSPSSLPAQVPGGHIVPALLAGNAVVFKPSEKTPATGAMLVDYLREAGVPDGAIRLLIGGREEGRALAISPDVDGLLFTGSAGAGLTLSRHFAETPGRMLALELGGNNPLVVWDGVDVHAAAAIAVQSAYLSAGQRNTCARRLIVRDGARGDLIGIVARLIDRLVIGAPHERPVPFMGPLIDNEAAARVEAAVHDLLVAGATAIRPLAHPFPGRPFLSPVLLDVTEIGERPDEEIFGPVLQVIRVADFDAAIAEANATRYGLSASLVGGGPEEFDRFWAETRTGAVNWNRPTSSMPATAPFGGVGLSGNHRPGGWYTADYCAYPVTSVEAQQARATISQGLRDS